jgi:hypothetical protein
MGSSFLSLLFWINRMDAKLKKTKKNAPVKMVINTKFTGAFNLRIKPFQPIRSANPHLLPMLRKRLHDSL